MDLVSKHHNIHESVSQPTITSPAFARVGSSAPTSFPILAVAVIGILATAFLLVSYYVFVIKCCLNRHRIDLLRRFSSSRGQNDQDRSAAYSPGLMESRGLDESVIRSIPVFKFKKREGNRDPGEKILHECAVCLNEFQEDEKLKIIPNCCHVFHIDCIDIWLQNNANCPLCRTSVSCEARFPETTIGGDEDFEVIELGTNTIPRNPSDRPLLASQERSNSGGLSGSRTRSISHFPRKIDRSMLNNKSTKLLKGTSVGDECLDIRAKDDQFGVQPIRRSISMDSSGDRHLYLAVQEAIQQQDRLVEIGETGCMEGCSSTNSKIKRPFFSFGSGRGSRIAVLPVHLDPQN